MQKQFYFLSPVEVVKVTRHNMDEVAEWCGGKVAATESRRVAGRMDSYVWVPTPKNTKVSWAFPGMFVTKRLVRSVKDELKITYAVFFGDYFAKNYFDSPQEAVAQTWERGVDGLVKKFDPEEKAKVAVPAPPKRQSNGWKSPVDEEVLYGDDLPVGVPEDVNAKMKDNLARKLNSGIGSAAHEEVERLVHTTSGVLLHDKTVVDQATHDMAKKIAARLAQE